MHRCEIISEFAVNCLLSSDGWWHLYLLKQHNCRMKQLYKITTSVKFWTLSISSSTSVLRGIECEIVVLVMFEFKLKKMSHRAINCGQGKASDDTRYVRKVPLNCLAA